MSRPRLPLDLSKLQVFPLADRRSLTRVDEILIDPDSSPRPCPELAAAAIRECAARIRDARKRDASVMLIYGAHLLRNGAALLIDRLMEAGWLTHLATNGAGTIHDWEYAWLGRSTESVADGVLNGRFGTWDETGRTINLALLAGGLEDLGYGEALGRLISDDGFTLPSIGELEASIRNQPLDSLTAARADLVRVMLDWGMTEGWQAIVHPHKRASILAHAVRRGVPLTVHPGIGYDIIANHPLFHGAAIGRAAAVDFRRFGAAVEGLDGGVVLSVGSAIMGPQVFEKSLSCVNNLRLQQGRPIVAGHSIDVVDLQDGGNWDWATGEPPKTNPAYYLRFCKSYSRMGGTMRYLQCDNALFIHHLLRGLNA